MIPSLYQIVSKAARAYPDKPAVIEPGKSITYKEFDEKIDSMAGHILAMGFKKGERAGILAKNSADSLAAYLAVTKAGGVSVWLNHTLSLSETVRQAKDCSLAFIYAGKGFEAKSGSIMADARSIRFVMDEAQARASLTAKRFPKIKSEGLASVVYTAGTTRRALGVMLSHKNLISNAAAVVKYARLKPSDSVVCVLPLYHIYGLSVAISHLLAGGTVMIDNRFMYPNLILDTIEKYRATGFAGVSSHYAMLLYMSDMPKRKLPSLRYLMQAGDRMPENITKRLVSLFPGKKLYLMYGQTEASPRIAYLDPGSARKKPGSIGRAIPGVTIKVVNESGRECREGKAGEIAVKGDNVMIGYWKNRRETRKVLKKGWLYTGDIAFKDKEGDLFIAGRRKGFVKIGGNKVNPAEIENVVLGIEGVMEAAAIGAKDPVLGERLKLFVTLVPGAKITSAEIKKICRSELPTYKVPQEVAILKDIPKNSFGKIAREELSKRS